MLGLALLVAGAKLGGFVAKRLGQPSVLGELFLGIILANLSPLIGGDSGMEFVRSNETLAFLAEVGVLILLFDVGLESDLRAFCKSWYLGSARRCYRSCRSFCSGMVDGRMATARQSHVEFMFSSERR